MGLIGGLFAPLVSRCNLWLLTPELFVRSPREYLRCFGERGARLTALPAFGLDYIVRRVRAGDLVGMDFSKVRGFVVGAEPIAAATLSRFHDLLAPFGLRSGTLLPAYGLAEATLAVSAVAPGEMWTTRPAPSSAAPLVGCGAPLEGIEIEIVDDANRPVPEGELGEIVVRGASVTEGYHSDHSSESLTSFEAGALRTGDAGFQIGGQLFPVGRLGDSIKIRGRAVFAELLEGELQKLGHRREHNTVVLGVRDGCPAVVWISEHAGSATADAVKVLSRLAEGAAVTLIRARRGAIPRTSSGKPCRKRLWNSYVHGSISGRVTLHSD
jgi:acyl-CoA synthetase (AMP-forming)/AMP-acid ligase II